MVLRCYSVTDMKEISNNKAQLSYIEPAKFTGAEDDLQSKCFQWAWGNFPEQRRMLFHVNNKAKNEIEGNQMKAKGVVAGVSDMVLIFWRGVAFLEFKTMTGRQRDKQKEFEAGVVSRKHLYIIIRTFEAFKHVFLTLIAVSETQPLKLKNE